MAINGETNRSPSKAYNDKLTADNSNNPITLASVIKYILRSKLLWVGV